MSFFDIDPKAPNGEPLPIPEGLFVSETPDLLRIELRTFSLGFSILALFCLAFGSALLSILPHINFENLFSGILAAVLIFVFTGLSFAGLYYSICRLINKTVLTADRQMLCVRHLPLPQFWEQKAEIPRKKIRQFYVTEKGKGVKEGPFYSYEIHCLFSGGEGQKVLQDSANAEQCLYIRQKTEQFYRIEHLPIAGEYGE